MQNLSSLSLSLVFISPGTPVLKQHGDRISTVSNAPTAFLCRPTTERRVITESNRGGAVRD